MTLLDMGVALGLGLAGSLHCLGMCGPVVLAWSIPAGGGASWRTRARDQALYHGGRIFTYMALGAAAGGLGHAVSSLARMERAASLAAGGLLVLAGLLLLGALRRPQLVQIGPAPWVTRTAGALLRSQARWRLGLVMGLLPCGLVYAATLQAMAQGNLFDGALTMLGFGLGTAGPLAALGFGSSLFAPWIRRWGTQVTALSVLVLGVLLVSRGMQPPPVTACHQLHP